MRPHLVKCLTEGEMTRFPCIKQRRVTFGRRVRLFEREELYCTCRLPNDVNREMIECTSCRKWFHNDCVGVGSGDDIKELKWKCAGCYQLPQ